MQPSNPQRSATPRLARMGRRQRPFDPNGKTCTTSVQLDWPACAMLNERRHSFEKSVRNRFLSREWGVPE